MERGEKKEHQRDRKKVSKMLYSGQDTDTETGTHSAVGVCTGSTQAWALQQSGMDGGGLRGPYPSLLYYLPLIDGGRGKSLPLLA